MLNFHVKLTHITLVFLALSLAACGGGRSGESEDKGQSPTLSSGCPITSINQELLANCDSDGDSVRDDIDDFPLDDTEDTDTDSDGIGNNADTDDDDDGTLDVDDDFPLDDAEDTDTDSDGIGNNADTDDDGDGTLDSDDDFPLDDTEDTDTDSDGIGNNADTDDDDDGTLDVDDDFPLDDTEDTDTDSDGIGNNADTDDDDDGTLDVDDDFPLDDTENTDTDSDGVGDNADIFPNDSDRSNSINDTGVVFCADYAHGVGSGNHDNDLDCIALGTTQTEDATDGDGDPVPAGQDAVFGRDAKASAGRLSKIGAGQAGFDFTKIDGDGGVLPASATEWDCVRDNVTGLIWEVKTNDGGLRDQDHTYTWYNSEVATNGVSAGTTNGGTCSGGTGCDTERFVADVNSVGLCGTSSWRMPTRNELFNIIVRNDGATIDLDYFPYTVSSVYWSSSPFAIYDFFKDKAWHMDFEDGDDGWNHKSNSYRVRLVQGSSAALQSNNVTCHAGKETSGISASTPTEDFIDHGDGTVTHNITGLMWMKCSLGQGGTNCTIGGATPIRTWKEALEAAQNYNDGAGTFGYSDWRLPNNNELLSITEQRCWAPAINLAIFPATPSEDFWTSSPSPLTNFKDMISTVEFSTGNLRASSSKSNEYFNGPRVRLVRTGN